jgi:hypothetical protein
MKVLGLRELKQFAWCLTAGWSRGGNKTQPFKFSVQSWSRQCCKMLCWPSTRTSRQGIGTPCFKASWHTLADLTLLMLSESATCIDGLSHGLCFSRNQQTLLLHLPRNALSGFGQMLFGCYSHGPKAKSFVTKSGLFFPCQPCPPLFRGLVIHYCLPVIRVLGRK